jgi:hypothetical protein
MEKVSLCYIAQGSCFRAIHSFQSLGFAIKEKEVEFIVKDAPKQYIKTVGDIEVELFVIDRTNDEKTAEYFTPIATNLTSKDVPLACLLNDVIRMATGDYVCIIPTGIFLQNDWLIDLIFYFKNIDNVGVVGISDKINNLSFLPTPSKDTEELTNVLIGDNDCIEGLFFTNRQHFYLVGAFDQDPKLEGEEFNQFCVRAKKMGMINFYVPSNNCIYNAFGNISNKEKQKAKEYLINSILEMSKTKSYYIPL